MSVEGLKGRHGTMTNVLLNFAKWASREPPIKTGMVAMGEASGGRSITHPFTIERGRKRIDLRVEEAEALRDWLAEQLKRTDVRRPFYR